MTFLNPLVLLGLVAAAIPLIIHLFNFRRPKKVDFSSLAFLKELQKTTMQRMRLKQLLLLLLRTLVFVCLILVFARPSLNLNLGSAMAGRGSSSVSIVIDNSLSMTLRDTDGGYLDQAKSIARGIVGQMSPGDEIFVITTASQNGPSSSPYTSRITAHDAIDDIEAKFGTEIATQVLNRIASMLDERSTVNKDIYFISDLQRSTFSDTVAFSMAENIHIALIPIGRRRFDNVAVVDVEIRSRIIEIDQPVRIEATLVNYGNETLEDYVTGVYLSEEHIAQRSVNLAPNIPTAVSFTATPKQRGWLPGILQIENDLFEPDNLRYFTLYVPEQRRILVVQGEEQEITYIDLALSPQLADGRFAFDLHTIPESSLAVTGLSDFDAVILVGPRTLSSGEVAALSRYVESGGGLLVFPGASAIAEDYNALLNNTNGGQFSGFSGLLDSRQPVAVFDRVDLEHPLFRGMFEQQGLQAETQVESPDVYYAMNYSPGAGTEQNLIQMSNGFPFMQEIRHGRGVMFLIAVAPNRRWSDFPVRGLFIPLLYRSVYYLSASISAGSEQLLVNEQSELRLIGFSGEEPFRLLSPDGVDFTPQQRSLFGATLLQIDAVAATVPGIYEIRTGEELVRRIAFNLNSRESNLYTLPPEDAVSHLTDMAGKEVFLLDSLDHGVEGIVQTIIDERTGVEIWNVFLVLALIFLLGEMYVAKQWRPEAVAT